MNTSTLFPSQFNITCSILTENSLGSLLLASQVSLSMLLSFFNLLIVDLSVVTSIRRFFTTFVAHEQCSLQFWLPTDNCDVISCGCGSAADDDLKVVDGGTAVDDDCSVVNGGTGVDDDSSVSWTLLLLEPNSQIIVPYINC